MYLLFARSPSIERVDSPTLNSFEFFGGANLVNYNIDKSCLDRVANHEQVSAFLGALRRSNVMRRTLILCPATVLSHWMAELHVWAPQLRVVVLHRCVQAFNAVSGSSGTSGDCSSFARLSAMSWHPTSFGRESAKSYSSSGLNLSVHASVLLANEFSFLPSYSKQENDEL